MQCRGDSQETTTQSFSVPKQLLPHTGFMRALSLWWGLPANGALAGRTGRRPVHFEARLACCFFMTLSKEMALVAAARRPNTLHWVLRLYMSRLHSLRLFLSHQLAQLL